MPATGPQDPATEDLVGELRGLVPADATVHVGGTTAAFLDQTDDFASRLPLLMIGVVGVSLLLLTVVFRSPAVAVKAALILFGLSMDYEAFLMSGVREAWVRTGDSRAAVVEGISRTGRVITAAAAIMVAVFAAFVPSDQAQWLPAWLDRRMPQVHVEGPGAAQLDPYAAEPVHAPRVPAGV